MKNKFLIFLFTILTFGLFLVPCSFAKDSSGYELNKVNRVYDISFNDNNNSATFYFYATDISQANYWYVSICFFDNDMKYDNSYTATSCKLYYKQNENVSSTYSLDMDFSGFDWERYYYKSFNSSLSSVGYSYITYTFTSSSMYDTFKNGKHYVNLLSYATAQGYSIPFVAQFIP